MDPAAVEVPRPDLAGFEPPVRRRIEERQAEVEARRAAAAADPEAGREALGEALGELGNHFRAIELFEAAERCYEQAVRLAPERHRWHYYLGATLAHRGKEAEAAGALERARERAPDDLPTLLRLGELYLRLDRPAEAGEVFARAAGLDPASAVAQFGLGRAAAASGDDAEAVRRFERALELQPRATSIHYRLAQALRRLGNLDEAERHLALRGDEGLTSRDPLLERVLELELAIAIDSIRSLAAQPDRLSDRELVSFAAAQLGGREVALEELRRTLEGDGEGPPRVQARLFFTLGSLQLGAGDDARAAASLARARGLDPGMEAVRLPLAHALERTGRPAEALAEVEAVLAGDPSDRDSRLLRALLLEALGRGGEALDELRVVVAAAPQDGLARLRLAAALEHTGDLAGAAAELERAVGLDLAGTDAALAHHRLGEILRRRGRPAQARERYRRALELDPTLHDARLGLAAALGQEGRYEEAVAAYREAVAERPDDATARVGEAAALLLLGRNREARERLEEGLAALPEDLALARMLARHLAACPEREVRDGARAVELATRVMREQASPESAETLAMALAEAGRFAEAVRVQEDLLGRARAAGATAAAERLRANLELYRESRSCCAG